MPFNTAAHLQQNLQLAGDGGGFAVVKALRAIPALQQEPFAPTCFRQLVFEVLDFPARDQRRQVTQLPERPFQRFRVGINRLLGGELALPRGWRPGFRS